MNEEEKIVYFYIIMYEPLPQRTDSDYGGDERPTHGK